MSLALLTLSLLTASSAQAQACGSNVSDHCWQITASTSNNVNLHNVRDVPTIGQSSPTDSQGGSNIIDGDEESTVTTTLTWMPANGDSVMDPPPDKNHPVHLIEHGYAYESSLGGGSGAGTADDGLGDPRDAGGVSQGNHLIVKDGSSGTITLDPVTVKAINPVSTYQSGYPGGGGGGGGYPGGGGPGWDWTGGIGAISFYVYLDPSASPRSVTITSSIDPTYHKGSAITDNGAPQPVQDLPGPDGTVQANTVKPGPDPQNIDITYYANPVGAWTPDSSYQWHIAQGTSSSYPSGTFTMPGDPPYSQLLQYYLYQIPGKPSQSEHAFIHLTDAGDGANATANYYVNWHDAVENWLPNGSSFPMPPTPYGDSKVSQPAGGQDTVEIDVPPGKVSATTGDKVLGGVLTTGVGILAVAAPETDPVIIGLLTAAGYTLSVQPDPADQSYKIPGTESQFEADVATQEAIDAGNTSGVFMPGLPRMTQALTDQVSLDGNYDDCFNGKHGTLFFSVQIFQLQWSQNFLGDAYGTHGYIGSAPGVVSWPGSVPPADYVFNWSVPVGH